MKRIIPLIILLWTGYMIGRTQISGRIEVNVNELSFSKQDGYDRIHWSGSDYKTQQVGTPELPVILKTYVIPLDAQMNNVEVSVSNRVAVDGSFTPYPVQPPIPIDDESNNVKFTQPDASIYQGTEVYPKVKAQIVADYNEMGYHLVTVQFHPVEYDPVSQKLFVSHLHFTLRYDKTGIDGIQPQKQSLSRANAIKKVIRSMVDNPEDVDGFTNQKVKLIGNVMPEMQTRATTSSMLIDVMQEQIPDYIIITNNELKSEFQRLADWKTQKGVPTLIKDVESIGEEYQGSDLAEKIHAYLQECYRKWGAGLFVLLGGDTNIIPARCYIDSDEEYPSDAYFSDLNSDWNANKNHIYREYDDGMKKDRLCYVGRASVENEKEAETFINKVFLYEKMENVSTNYLMNHLAASAYISKESNGKLYNSGKDSIDKYLSQYPQINKWYLFDHYNCTCSQHDDKTIYHSGQELNKEHFLSALQNGGDSGLDHFHVVYHMDHCNPRSIGTSCKDKHEYMYVQDVDNLKNGGYPQIVISGGCEPAQFTENCIVEHFLTSQKGGAVAFIGNANVGWSSEHKQYKKFLKSLYNDGFQQLGILYGTMLQNYRDDYYRLHLLGDPEMPVWSAVPKNLEVNVTPTQMEAGTNTITVQIANLPAGEEATLCLMKDIEAYTVVTVNDTKPHSFTFGPKMPGDIKVTVTARNFIPFEGKIPVQRNNGNAISIVDIEKFDGTLYGGGTYNLNIGLRDDGRTSAYNVSAKLSTSSPYVTIVKDSVYYGLLHEFYTVRGKSDFTVKVSSQAPDIDRSERNAVCFFLSISRDGTDEIEVDTFKVDLKQLYQKINYFYIRKTSDGDLIPEPGETVWVNLNRQYEGNASLLTNTVVPVDTAMAKIPDGEQNALNRRVIISKNYKTGDPLRLKYTFRTDGKATDSLTVDIARQAASPDLSQIHTQSESDAISLYWDKMDSTNLYNVYRSLKEDGTYVQLNKSPISTRYYKDETAGALTEYYYKLGLVADDYFEMGRSEAVRSWTTYPTMGMFPLSMDMSRQYVNEANTADFDYDGQKEIILTGRNDEWTQGTLAVIRPDGTEPYDIDGNATSYSGFANISCKTEAVPAVADLKGDGEPCIISLTRNYNNSNDSVICFSSLDKNGDKLPDILWKTDIGKMSCYRGAVVTDIDVPDLKGEKEIIFRSEFSQKPVVVMDADGQIKASFGNFTGDFFGGLAVADLDGDGYKEIICGDKNGSLYVWRHDGTPYKQRSPFFSRPGQMLNCSPVVCDLDGDGEKEILITTRSTALSQIFAIKQDGSCVGSFDTNSTEPATIPYVTHGIEHALSVGDVNKDGNIEVVALGHGCVRVWSHTGDLLTDRDVPGLFPESGEYINVTAPILADVDGDETSEIVFHQDNLIYALRHDGTDVKGFPITAPAEIINGVCVSDMDGDGKNEIIAADLDGNISAWKTDGKSTTIEWGRARFDTGFTGEYVPHYEDPKVITASAEWEGGTFTNDIIVRAGTFRIASGKNLQMREGCRILVLEGGTLEVDGGTIDNADVSVKAGGTLDIKNNGVIHLNRFGKIEAGKGATVNALYGEVQTAR